MNGIERWGCCPSSPLLCHVKWRRTLRTPPIRSATSNDIEQRGCRILPLSDSAPPRRLVNRRCLAFLKPSLQLFHEHRSGSARLRESSLIPTFFFPPSLLSHHSLKVFAGPSSSLFLVMELDGFSSNTSQAAQSQRISLRSRGRFDPSRSTFTFGYSSWFISARGRCTHLLPIFGKKFLPIIYYYSNSLDTFAGLVLRQSFCGPPFPWNHLLIQYCRYSVFAFSAGQMAIYIHM